MRYLMCAVIAALLTPAAGAEQTAVHNYPSYEPGVTGGYTAREIRDAVVHGPTGQKIGEIADLIIAPDGTLRRLIVSVDEHFLGIGGRRLAIDWQDLRVSQRTGAGVRTFTAPVTKQNVGRFGLFKSDPSAIQGAGREWRASELLGDTIRLEDVENFGIVTDLVFDRNGHLRAIAASPDIGNSMVPFYVPFYGAGAKWDPGSAHYTLPYSENELRDQLPKDAALASAMGLGMNPLLRTVEWR